MTRTSTLSGWKVFSLMVVWKVSQIFNFTYICYNRGGFNASIDLKNCLKNKIEYPVTVRFLPTGMLLKEKISVQCSDHRKIMNALMKVKVKRLFGKHLI